MEARDSGSKIRPLPIDDIDGDAPKDRQIESRRPWAPIVVIVAGAIAFGVIARGFGPGDGSDVATASTTSAPIAAVAEATTTSTTESPQPLPRPLRELLPTAEDGLGLITMSSTTAKIGDWDLGSTSPSFGQHISQPFEAHYNSDGTRAAVLTGVKDGSIVIASLLGDRPGYIQQDITTGRWHPTDPDLFAWTEDIVGEPDEVTLLEIADVSGFTAAGIEPLISIELAGDNHALLAWGDWGFVTTAGPTTYVLDPDGELVSTTDSRFFDATSDGSLLFASYEDDAAMPYLIDPEGAQINLAGLDIGASDFRLTSDGAWVLAVTNQADGHTSILARTIASRSTRLTSINEGANIVGLAWDDRFLVLQESQSNDLVFKDWNTGAEFRLTVEDAVAAVFL